MRGEHGRRPALRRWSRRAERPTLRTTVLPGRAAPETVHGRLRLPRGGPEPGRATRTTGSRAGRSPRAAFCAGHSRASGAPSAGRGSPVRAQPLTISTRHIDAICRACIVPEALGPAPAWNYAPRPWVTSSAPGTVAARRLVPGPVGHGTAALVGRPQLDGVHLGQPGGRALRFRRPGRRRRFRPLPPTLPVPTTLPVPPRLPPPAWPPTLSGDPHAGGLTVELVIVLAIFPLPYVLNARRGPRPGGGPRGHARAGSLSRSPATRAVVPDRPRAHAGTAGGSRTCPLPPVDLRGRRRPRDRARPLRCQEGPRAPASGLPALLPSPEAGVAVLLQRRHVRGITPATQHLPGYFSIVGIATASSRPASSRRSSCSASSSDASSSGVFRPAARRHDRRRSSGSPTTCTTAGEFSRSSPGRWRACSSTGDTGGCGPSSSCTRSGTSASSCAVLRRRRRWSSRSCCSAPSTFVFWLLWREPACPSPRPPHGRIRGGAAL